MKVDQYFDRLVAGKSRLRPLPSALATLLRDRSEIPDLRWRDSTVPSSWPRPSGAKTDSTKAKAGCRCSRRQARRRFRAWPPRRVRPARPRTAEQRAAGAPPPEESIGRAGDYRGRQDAKR